MSTSKFYKGRRGVHYYHGKYNSRGMRLISKITKEINTNNVLKICEELEQERKNKCK